MSGRGAGSFRRTELLGSDGPVPDQADLDAAAAMAAELERVAREPSPRPSRDFAARVAAAVASEPLPAPSIAARESLRHGSAGGFARALVDSVRIAFGPARPAVMRSQAFALLIVVVLGASALGGATAFAASRFVFEQPVTQTETPIATSASPSVSPSPTANASDDASAEPEASGSEDPSETEATGNGTQGTARPAATPTANHDGTSEPTSKATDTPKPTQTHESESASPTPTAAH